VSVKKFKPGIEGVFPGLPENVYRKAPGLNQSSLKPLAISPAHYLHAAANPMKPTAEMIFGRIAHQLVFTPQAPKWWAVRPPGLDLRTPEGKAWKAKNMGKEWVDWQTNIDISGAVLALKQHKDFKAAVKTKVRELSIFKRLKFGPALPATFSLLRKCRIDLVPAGVSLCDAKFVEDATQFGFSKAIYTFKWYLQAAYYLDLYNDSFPKDQKSQFVIFAVEKNPPYPVVTHVLDEAAIVRGRTEYLDLLNLYVKCQASNHWPKTSALYPDKPVTTGLPKYANKGVTAGDYIFQ
jgi:hypothetical protein